MNTHQCPNCHSFKMTDVAVVMMIVGFIFICLGIMLFFLLIPLALIPIGITLIVYGIYMKTSHKNTFICQNCHMQIKP